LQGNIGLRTEQLEIFSRPGIDGAGARKTGSRARPVTLRSISYVADWTAAKAALVAYQGLIGQDPKTVIQHSINWGSFLVLNVSQTEARAVENAIGTIVATPTVRLVCDWSILG